MKIPHVLLFIFVLALIPVCLAHQPRIIESSSLITIQNPEISQAFYSELKGQSAFYRIESENPFVLYLNLLVPKISSTRTDFSLEISYFNLSYNLVSQTTLNSSDWTEFYEEFAGDYYLRGPEIEKNSSPGFYELRVYNPENQGKYVLAVGKVESFPAKEALNALVSMPRLKAFFDKSPIKSFQGIIGKILLVLVIVIILLLLLAAYIIKRILKHKKK